MGAFGVRGRAAVLGKGVFLGLFLCAQLLAAAHFAEYGENQHDHGGIPCTIQLLHEAGSGLSVPPLAVSWPPGISVASGFEPDSRPYGALPSLPSSIRAPPRAIA